MNNSPRLMRARADIDQVDVALDAILPLVSNRSARNAIAMAQIRLLEAQDLLTSALALPVDPVIEHLPC